MLSNKSQSEGFCFLEDLVEVPVCTGALLIRRDSGSVRSAAEQASIPSRRDEEEERDHSWTNITSHQRSGGEPGRLRKGRQPDVGVAQLPAAAAARPDRDRVPRARGKSPAMGKALWCCPSPSPVTAAVRARDELLGGRAMRARGSSLHPEDPRRSFWQLMKKGTRKM